MKLNLDTDRTAACLANVHLLPILIAGLLIQSRTHAQSAEVSAGSVVPAAASMATAAQPPTLPLAETLVIRQTFNDRMRVVAEMPKGTRVEVGDEYIASFAQQEQCSTQVVEVRPPFVTISTESCRFSNSMRPAQRLERSLLPMLSVSTPRLAAPTPTPAASPVPPQYPAPVVSGAPQESRPMAALAPRLIDLSFFPRAGGHDVSFQIRRTEERQTESLNGRSIVSMNATALATLIDYRIGLTNHWSFETTIGHTLSSSVDTSYGPASIYNGQSSTTVIRGLYDPMFTVEGKLLEQIDRGLTGFLALAVQPSLLERKTGDSKRDGTPTSGGHSAGLRGRLVRRGPIFESEVQASFTYRDRRSIRNEGLNKTYTLTGGDAFGLRGTLALSPNPDSAFHIGLQWAGIASTKTEAPGVDTVVTNEVTTTGILLGYRSLLFSERSSLEFEVIVITEANYQAKTQTEQNSVANSGNSARIAYNMQF